MERPLLGITMGDPTGVGPEVVVGAWRDAAAHAAARLVVFGSPEILRRAARLLDSPVQVVEVGAAQKLTATLDVLPCIACCDSSALLAPPATVDARGGHAAYNALLAAAEMAVAGQVDGIVTAPLSKAALWAAGYRYPGHTELLSEFCRAGPTAMMLYLNDPRLVRGRVGLGVVHVTLHTALRDVHRQLDVEGIRDRVRLADSAVQSFLDASGHTGKPRIGVCALNPHGGEAGLFGDEEAKIIEPAVRLAQDSGLDAAGPYPADTLMMRAVQGDFDAVVAMYHDQGHIALKLLGLHGAVNVTLGLPIVRTSVAHGTAYDRAWQGTAETGGMTEAIRVAAQLARHRKAHLAARVAGHAPPLGTHPEYTAGG